MFKPKGLEHPFLCEAKMQIAEFCIQQSTLMRYRQNKLNIDNFFNICYDENVPRNKIQNK